MPLDRVLGEPVTLSAILALLLTALVAPLSANAQPAGKVYRIGVLLGGDPRAGWAQRLPQGLREHGYVEGRNVVMEVRAAEGRAERLPAS